MSRRALLVAAGVLLLAARGEALDNRQRTDSGQFTIYCDDANLRRQVASFAEQTKDNVIQLLGESDRWRRPIVISLEHATADNAKAAPARLLVLESDVGMKIEIAVRIGDDPADVNLQQHVVRAVLLEYMYREQGVRAGVPYAEPPWWIVAGAVEIFRSRDLGTESDFFRKLVETNKLPPIAHFLSEKPNELGPTALAVDHALAMCLLQLLIEQPGGRDHLAAFVRGWPRSDGDPVAALLKEFSGLADGSSSLQKWWTINLARFAATDRHKALSAEETDRAISALLTFDVAQTKKGETKPFAIGDFAQFAKLPGRRAACSSQSASFATLSTRANALLQPVISEYEKLFALLARGKTRGLRARIERADRLRGAIVRRVGEIADYMNWFEATQMGARSNAFDSYLRTANELSEEEKTRRDPVAQYLDGLEREY